MKKQFFSIFLTTAVLVATILAFASCSDPGLVGTGAAGSTEEVQTDAPVSSDPAETETNATSESDKESQSETQTEALSEVDSVSLNMDLFEEYGMTYAELKEKHGKLTYFDGIQFYEFENGYGRYGFYTDWEQNEKVHDPETGIEYRKLDDGEKCRFIHEISPESLFNEPFETLSIETISNIEGLRFIETVPDGIVTQRAYATTFTYDGWNDDKVHLFVYHEDEKMIDLSSEARVFIHPDDIVT